MTQRAFDQCGCGPSGLDGAAQESNLPTRELHELTGFEDNDDPAWLRRSRRVLATPLASQPVQRV
jgi:hypothetical protein